MQRVRQVGEHCSTSAIGYGLGDDDVLLTSRARDSACANLTPPQAMISSPGSERSEVSSSWRSPLAILDCGHVASVSVLEKTTFGISFIGAAYSPVAVGQTDDICS